MAAGANQAIPTAKISDVIATFRPTRLFKSGDSKTSVTSLDFDDSGELALIARDDETLQIYNCKEGKHAKELKSQKYGVHLARFTHHAQSIIYASTKVDDGLRYLSSHDNSYIRYFRGHTSTVTSLALSPASDNFLSCSADNTVKLWSLNSPNAQGELKIHCPYLCAYDPSATVIAVASPPTQSILLYDLRNYDKPPFASFDTQSYEARFTPKTAGRDWTKIEFSNDGKHILLATNGAGHFLLDAFDGAIRWFCHRAAGSTMRASPGTHPPSASPPAGQGDVCFSPDGRYLIGGSGQNGILVWDTQTPRPAGAEKVLEPMTELPGPKWAAIVAYNPRHNLIVSADKDVMFWLPDPDLAP
ncbi:WD repeat-containing protein-like protein [Cryomyces antarcticus]|uniref:Anaphase-promoting complex subunit 4 WD40 domain-containing protein n=1 Tax=Cryomyces antarcticus TaxID=329879 RepID=A0ABR0LZF7_9PEZI|nr:hypothetical protein LTR39_000857 [Cryomyces antarcticus]KAK5257233.1 hypothetical protein LTR16_001228 [Cryomyces antarcticus]